VLKYITIYITILFAVILLPLRVQASSRVGVFVLHSNQSSKSACVEINTPTISGRDLLEKSGFNPVFDSGFLVELDKEKSQSAWQSRTGDGYWYSFVLSGSSWRTINAGAMSMQLNPGEVYGWQNHAGSSILPVVTFDLICPTRPIPSPISIPEVSQQITVLSEPDSKTLQFESSPVVSPVLAEVSPLGANSPIVKGTSISQDKSKTDHFIYILIGSIVLGALGGLVLSHRRK